MNNIKFYDISLEQLTADQLTRLFANIRDEIAYHHSSHGIYPKQLHVYRTYLDMTTGHVANKQHCVICISDNDIVKACKSV